MCEKAPGLRCATHLYPELSSAADKAHDLRFQAVMAERQKQRLANGEQLNPGEVRYVAPSPAQMRRAQASWEKHDENLSLTALQRYDSALEAFKKVKVDVAARRSKLLPGDDDWEATPAEIEKMAASKAVMERHDELRWLKKHGSVEERAQVAALEHAAAVAHNTGLYLRSKKALEVGSRLPARNQDVVEMFDRMEALATQQTSHGKRPSRLTPAEQAARAHAAAQLAAGIEFSSDKAARAADREAKAARATGSEAIELAEVKPEVATLNLTDGTARSEASVERAAQEQEARALSLARMRIASGRGTPEDEQLIAASDTPAIATPAPEASTTPTRLTMPSGRRRAENPEASITPQRPVLPSERRAAAAQATVPDSFAVDGRSLSVSDVSRSGNTQRVAAKQAGPASSGPPARLAPRTAPAATSAQPSAPSSAATPEQAARAAALERMRANRPVAPTAASANPASSGTSSAPALPNPPTPQPRPTLGASVPQPASMTPAKAAAIAEMRERKAQADAAYDARTVRPTVLTRFAGLFKR